MKRFPFPTLTGNDGASDEVRRPADSEDPGGAHEGAPAMTPGGTSKVPSYKKHQKTMEDPLGKVY